MGKFIDITGQRFGRLVVVKRDGTCKVSGHALWFCKCDCGNTVTTLSTSLRRHLTKSCGCYQKHIARDRYINNTLGLKNGHHVGGQSTRIWKTWKGMMQRCYMASGKSYRDYGGRGIAVCKRWHKFENFLSDMGESPAKGHSLDRIDNNGNYCLSNCKWSTAKQQARNRRNNKLITYNKQTLCISEWGEQLGVDRKVIASRIRHGWSIKRTLTTSVVEYKKRKKNG